MSGGDGELGGLWLVSAARADNEGRQDTWEKRELIVSGGHLLFVRVEGSGAIEMGPQMEQGIASS